MFSLEDEAILFLYCWTFNEMQIPATRDRCRMRPYSARQNRPEGAAYARQRGRSAWPAG